MTIQTRVVVASSRRAMLLLALASALLGTGVLASAQAQGLPAAEGEEVFYPPQPLAPTTEQVAKQDVSPVNSIDETHPERSIPTPEEAIKRPLEMGYLIMDLVARGEAAIQRGDHEAAIRYFRAVAKGVPDRAISFMKLCKAYRELGKPEEAMTACKAGLGRGGATVDDHAYFVRMVLSREQPPEGKDLEDVRAVIEHLKLELGVERGAKLTVAQLQCEVATRLEDEDGLQECTSELARLAPNDPKTLSFSWALALKRHDFDGAEKIIAQAREADVPVAAVQAMEDGTLREQEKVPALLRLLGRWQAQAGLALAATLALMFMLARRKVLVRGAST